MNFIIDKFFLSNFSLRDCRFVNLKLYIQKYFTEKQAELMKESNYQHGLLYQ